MYALYLRATTIEVVGIIYEYEPTTTDGSRVPNKDWKSVLNPETKSNVCITLDFSACDKKTPRLDQLKRKTDQERKTNVVKENVPYSLHHHLPFEEQSNLESKL